MKVGRRGTGACTATVGPSPAAIVVWMMILVSHLSFRRHHDPKTLPVRMPLFPWMQIFGLLMLSAVLITMGLSKDYNVSWEFGVPWMLLISGAYLLWARAHKT